ncbi:hypothetical protein V6Z11_D07G234400 [Gossypium hirsutum]|uniref:Replication protein A 32 kDa subunit B isoform X1 n=1 Tax=Gossypium hirsutum TaxID=3635 RepID=A0ABM3AGB3_GOSHI|nr:replication protein A 32 kDa subunit B-like isoform X1 [Gossypium hirsutum]
MMQTNEFHGNTVFSGGGFMPSQATQTVPDRPSSSYKSDARCSMPLTVKQLKDLSRVGESGISIDGVDVNNGGMTTQPEVANSNFGNPTKSYGYQTNLTNQFSGQYNTVEEQIRGVSSKVLQYLRRLACL